MTTGQNVNARAFVEDLRARYQDNAAAYRKLAADHRIEADKADVLAAIADEDAATCDLMLAREHSATIYADKHATYLDGMTTKGDEAAA